jgi:Holliday junction resolvasome RuvABC ATP-dependent DNA helicase subunit
MKSLQLIFPTDFSDEERLWHVNPANPDCPYNQYTGNEKAITRLSRAAWAALGNANHSCTDQFFALVGPASVGKTTLVKLHAEVIGIPMVKIHPTSIKRVHDVFMAIAKVCEETSCGNDTLKMHEISGNRFIAPPCIVFIDEVHALKNQVVQGLLKATEHDDAELVTESGYILDTSNVCWIIATTDRGLLFDAFDTRFEKIQLNLFSKAEMACIVKKHHPELPTDACELIAFYNGIIPREALSFTRDVLQAKKMYQKSWLDTIKQIAEEREIDEFGMTRQRLKILTALGERSIATPTLSRIANCKPDELQKFIMPPLVTTNADQPEPFVIMSQGRGYCITPAGLEQLDKRKIENAGLNAIPKAIRPEPAPLRLNADEALAELAAKTTKKKKKKKNVK